jgi:dTDP-4-dehydrorhamnose reductase
VHISTDYVFDGRAPTAYKPHDATNPVSVYGRTKLRGEQAVLEVLAERATILRTAWVYAPRGKNFLLTMLRLMRDRESVRVVADQHGTPTTADSIAGALWALADRPDIHGITHWTDGGRATWHGFAAAIAEDARAAGLLPATVQVLPISTAEYPTPARRPANSVLDCGELIARLGRHPAPWRANLRATLAQVQ